MSGVSEAAIKQYERDLRRPRLEQLEKLASALDMPFSDLIHQVPVQRIVRGNKVTHKFFMSLENPYDGLDQSALHSDKVFEEDAKNINDSLLKDWLIDAFNILNRRGKMEAVLRIRELDSIPRFSKGLED